MHSNEIGEVKKISKGSEGTVYKVIQSGKCVKIFHSSEIAKEKEDKITFMTGVSSLKKHANLSWPQECIYDSSENFIGYVMNCAPEGSTPLTSYFNARMYELDTHLLVHCAMNLVRTCLDLHKEGITICDFNPNNFLISKKGECFFVDTDNFQFRTTGNREYKPAVACSMYQNKDLQELLSDGMSSGMSLSKIVPGFPYGSFNRKTDIWAVCVLVFQILMNGTHPFTGKYDGENISLEVNIYHDYAPYFGKGNSYDIAADKPSISVMSKELQNFFYNIFFGNFEPEKTEEKFLSVLNTYSHSLTNHCGVKKNHHYLSHINNCPWCKIDREKNKIEPRKDELTSTVSKKKVINQSNSLKNTPLNKGTGATPVSNTAGNTSPISQYNSALAKKSHKKRETKGNWMWGVFILICVAQVYLFAAGYIKEFYDANVGGADQMMILGGLAPYLLLLAGIAVSFFVTTIFIECDFGISTSIILNIGTQIVSYLALLWIVAIFISIASFVLIAIIIIVLIRAFLDEF